MKEAHMVQTHKSEVPESTGTLSGGQVMIHHAPASPQALLEHLCGMMRTQSLHHAARLRIAELVKDGPKSVSELAEATQTHAPSLSRLLRALDSIGIFTEIEPEHFAQTPLSALLQPNVPGSMYHIALLHGDQWQWHVW